VTGLTVSARPAVVLPWHLAAALVPASAIGTLALGWPLVADHDSPAARFAGHTPWLMALLLAAVLLVLLADLGREGLPATAVALLGALAAVIAIVRPLGGGVAGLEPVWAVIILAGAVLGPGFGFALGVLGLFTSALLGGGVGPWLPFQMIIAGWVGLMSGLIPWGRIAAGWPRTTALAIFGSAAALAAGVLLNLWFWPTAQGLPAPIAYDPTDSPGERLGHLLAFTAATSLGFDVPRALLTAALLAVGTPLLWTSLARAARRAHVR